MLVRMGTHEPTKKYVQRRTQEGLSKPEIMRCLKRYVARELFPVIQAITAPTANQQPIGQPTAIAA